MRGMDIYAYVEQFDVFGTTLILTSPLKIKKTPRK
jgi:hypothetical protein